MTKVLIVDFDTFSSIGGGQTAYQNLFSGLDELEVTNLTKTSDKNTLSSRYRNVCPDKLFSETDKELLRKKALCLGINSGTTNAYMLAREIASAVKGEFFDIVESPDYLHFFRFLPAAFEYENIPVERFVQSLHGRLSTTYEYEWDFYNQPSSRLIKDMKEVENQNLTIADTRYAISQNYIAELSQFTPQPISYVDPLTCLGPDLINQRGLMTTPATASPSPYFVGRLERRKGPDLFLETIWNAEQSLNLNSAYIIGASTNLNSRSSSTILEQHIHMRGLNNVKMLNQMSRLELFNTWKNGAPIIMLPSRYDTFNLLALEAIFFGKPTLVSTTIDAYRFINETLGEGLIFPFACSDMAQNASTLQYCIENYHTISKTINEQLKDLSLQPDYESLLRAYSAKKEPNENVRSEMKTLFGIMKNLEDSLESKTLNIPLDTSKQAISFTPPSHNRIAQSFLRLNKIMTLSDNTEDEIHAKIVLLKRYLYDQPFVLRGSAFKELARLESLTGNKLLAAAYNLRQLRWQGTDHNDLLAATISTLRNNNLSEEAKVASLMYSNDTSKQEKEDQIRHYLTDRFSTFQKKPVFDDPIETVCDFRTHKKTNVKVSIIVSLYNVSQKHLEKFYKTTSKFSMVQRQEAEILFVDSGSDTPQWALLEGIAKDSPVEFAVFRTPKRETIQMAWNRGILKAKGCYLAFLGVDETIRPDALDILSSLLDHTPDADWAMGSSLVTSVDDDGAFQDIKMKYDRTHLSKNSMLVDCCYLSYVGGLYRSTIHKKYGYYDTGFRGAGDTEFKCRMHPQIGIVKSTQDLGLFLDYPSARVTASYQIEIEDLRAWYIFRTPGGLNYILQNTSKEEREYLFWSALSKGRSFVCHNESDIELAKHVLDYILERAPDSPLSRFKNDINLLCKSIRDFKYQDAFNSENLKAIIDAFDFSIEFFKKLQVENPTRDYPVDFLTDAHFFAHTWVWQEGDCAEKSRQVLLSGKSYDPAATLRLSETGNSALHVDIDDIAWPQTLYNFANHSDFETFHDYYQIASLGNRNHLIFSRIAWIWQYLKKLFDLTARPIGVYGAGQHTKWLLEAVSELAGPPIAYIVDDRKAGETINDIPIINPKDIKPTDICALVLSSDTYEVTMAANAKSFLPKEIELIRLYKDLPAIGRTKPYKITV